MTLSDKPETLDNKIKANQPQYDLDRKPGKMSALWSNELDKYGYMTVEDLGYKQQV